MSENTITSYQSFVKKLTISITFGLIGLLFSGYGIQIPFGDFQLNFIWSIAFPLLITLTYGLRFGLLSMTCGLTFLYPFFLGYINGYASFVAMLVLFIWVTFHGIAKQRRELSRSLFNHPLTVQLYYSIVRLIIYALLFQPLIKLNPPPWNPEAVTSIQPEIIWYFSLRGVFMEMILLLIVDTLLLLPVVRRFFGLKVNETMRYNSRVLLSFLVGGLLFISIILAVQYTFIDELSLSEWLLPPNAKTALTLFLSSFLFIIMAGVTMKYVEKTLANEFAYKSTYKRYQAIFEQMQDICLELALDGTIINASPSLYQTLQMTDQQLIGTNFFKLVTDAKQSEWLAELEELGGFLERKATVKTLTARTLVWSVHLKRIQITDEDARLIALIRDMTEVEQAMNEVKRLNSDLERRVNERTADLHATVDALERFNYVVSHDLKTPIRAIDAYVEMVEEDECEHLSNEAIASLASVRNISRDMIRLIERLLYYSRMTKTAINHQDVSLEKIVSDVLQQLKATHTFSVSKPDVLPTISGDCVLIQQVFLNVLDNAVAYKKSDEPLFIKIESCVKEDTVSVSITDNGIGMDQGAVSDVWELFMTKHAKKGTGIGLATVKRVMEAHGGIAELFSEPQVGTTVTLTFPTS